MSSYEGGRMMSLQQVIKIFIAILSSHILISYANNPVASVKSSPYIVAHRGNEGAYPENSIIGIISAINKGVDYIEIDVRVTKDGVPVLMHDSSINRTMDCGSNPQVEQLYVAEYDYNTIEEFCILKGQYSQEKIPLLSDVLNFLKFCSKSGKMYALQAILGHKNIQITIDLYGQLQACDVEMVSPYD